MTRFMTKLRASGYRRTQRWEILKSGTRRYNKMVESESRGIRRVNRPRWEGGGRRIVKKIMAKRNWFKKRKREGTELGGDDVRTRRGIIEGRNRESKDETEPETVMFIPSTPGGELLKQMREADLSYRKGRSR